MKLEVQIDRKTHRIELIEGRDVSSWFADGHALEADGKEVSPGVYSILVQGESFEVRVERIGAELRATTQGRDYKVAIRDPREWKKNRAGAAEAEGRQQVLAPMPGKVVRVLVAAGDEVQAGQGLMVVEAMKMQNEIRAPKSGKIESLSVIEGQTVNSGEVVAVVS
ncbi:MAG: biotin/lipoyl-containing protein [Candidatus Acidiferrales bacterium]